MQVQAITACLCVTMLSAVILLYLFEDSGGRVFDCAKNFVAPPVVEIDCGKVQGQGLADGAMFLGIPFAAPPIGQRRWLPPTSLRDAGQCWNDTYEAVEYGPACLQGNADGDENCLFLNVFVGRSLSAHQTPATRLPVMVFLSGGGLNMGGNAAPISESQRYSTNESIRGNGTWATFAADASKPMVVVTVSYRVGLMGFFAAEELGASGRDHRNSTGNYGFLDQLEALRWVNRNIAAFSGDPTRISIFGQSSGATSIFALLASPVVAREQLFAGAVMLSGSPNMTATLSDVRRNQQYLVEVAGCARFDHASARLDCLLRQNGSTLQALIRPGSFGDGNKASFLDDAQAEFLTASGSKCPLAWLTTDGPIAGQDGVLFVSPLTSAFGKAGARHKKQDASLGAHW